MSSKSTIEFPNSCLRYDVIQNTYSTSTRVHVSFPLQHRRAKCTLQQGSSLLSRRGTRILLARYKSLWDGEAELGSASNFELSCCANFTRPTHRAVPVLCNTRALEYMPQCWAGDHWSERTTVLKLNWVGPTIEITGAWRGGVRSIIGAELPPAWSVAKGLCDGSSNNSLRKKLHQGIPSHVCRVF